MTTRHFVLEAGASQPWALPSWSLVTKTAPALSSATVNLSDDALSSYLYDRQGNLSPGANDMLSLFPTVKRHTRDRDGNRIAKCSRPTRLR